MKNEALPSFEAALYLASWVVKMRIELNIKWRRVEEYPRYLAENGLDPEDVRQLVELLESPPLLTPPPQKETEDGAGIV